MARSMVYICVNRKNNTIKLGDVSRKYAFVYNLHQSPSCSIGLLTAREVKV